ncbi:MAG: PKD domain-containing protein, partial [Saprospiraceae bacterium]|nr:PKD domain-containing protein [Saprospiraceae bacterium]
AFNINGSDEVTFTDYITVGDVPTADFSPNLTGNIVDFTNLSTDADSYSWSFGDGGSSTEADPTHTYNQVGMYTVQLIATNECGSDTATVQIEVIVEIPTAGFGADSQEGCVPFTVQFFDDSEGEPTAWNWMFPGGTPSSSTEQDPVVTYNAAGVYSVSLTVTNLAGTNTLNQLEFIEVGDVPEAEFSFAIDMADVMFTNLSTGATTYTWDFGDGQMSAQASPTHTYQQSGIYTVMLTATNACGSTSFTQEVTVMVDAVDEITFLDRLLVFPNPNDGQFWLVLEGESLSGRQLEISLLTVLGQVVRQEELTFHANQFQKGYDYRYLAKGVYILQLRSGGQIGYHKLVID